MSAKKDPRVRAFLRQAMPVIAASGGLNEHSQERLRLLAENLRLTDAEWRGAWDELVAAETHRESLTRYEQAFAKLIRDEWRKLPDRILSLKVENRAIRLAETRFQISEVRARQIMDRECDRLRIARVSRSDAEDFVEQVVIQEMEGQREPTPTQLQRLYSFAKQWGVRREVVDSFVDDAIADNIKGWQRLERMSLAWQRVWLFALFAVVTLGLGAYLIYATRAKPTQGNSDLISENETEQAVAWWPKGAIEQQLVGTESRPTWGDDLFAAPRQSPQQRLETYLRCWVQEITVPNPAVRPHWLRIFGLVLAADPDVTAVDTWLEQTIAECYAEPLTAVRESELRRKLNCWELVAELAALSTEHNLGTLELIEGARKCLHRQFGGDWDFQNSPEQSLAKVRSLILVEHWRRARQTMYLNPNQAALQIIWLRQLNESQSDPEPGRHMHARVVVEFIQTNTNHWAAVQSEIETALQHSSDQELLKWLRVHLAAPTPIELCETLNRPLLERLFDYRPGLSQSEIDRSLYAGYLQLQSRRYGPCMAAAERLAQTCRQLSTVNLGDSADPQTIAQWAQLTNDALNLMVIIDSGDFQRIPATLGEASHTQFGFSSQNSRESTSRAVTAATPSDWRTVREAMAVLIHRRVEDEARRRSAISRLADVAERINDLDDEDAAVLATYYLSPLAPVEWLHAERHAPHLLTWPKFVLALAYAIQDGLGEVDHATTLVQLATGRELELTREQPWRITLIATLKRHAAFIWQRKIRAESETDNRNWQQLADMLRDVYERRNDLIHPPRPSAKRAPQDLQAAVENLVLANLDPDRLVSHSGLRQNLLATNDLQNVWLVMDWFLRREFERMEPRVSGSDVRAEIAELSRHYQAAISSEINVGVALLHTERHACLLYKIVADDLLNSMVLAIPKLRTPMQASKVPPANSVNGSVEQRASWPAELDVQLSLLRPEQPADYRDVAEELMFYNHIVGSRELAMRLYLVGAYHSTGSVRSSSLRGLVAAARDDAERSKFIRLHQLWDAHQAAPSRQDVPLRRPDESGRRELSDILDALVRGDSELAHQRWLASGSQVREWLKLRTPLGQDIEHWTESSRLSDQDRYRVLAWWIQLDQVGEVRQYEGLLQTADLWAMSARRPLPIDHRLPTLTDVSEFDPRLCRWVNNQWIR
ncbi:MAG TPA: hypothetical protein PKD54_02980 [Pirellulaceae bacterium]|nr:hypothetical protein [Pirellulaceae bacterium]